MAIAKVNPMLFRELQYLVTISPDVMNPKSEELIRAYDLEAYDRMIAQPLVFDPEEAGKLLLSSNPSTRNNPDKYIAKTPAVQPQVQEGAVESPLNTLVKKKLSPANPHESLASVVK